MRLEKCDAEVAKTGIYPKSCLNNKIEHMIFVPEDDYQFISNGIAELKPKTVAAGESFDIEMEWDWSNKNAGHDWSVTVYGEKAAATLVHKGGLKTQHLPTAGPKK